MSEMIISFCDVCNPEKSVNRHRGFAYAPIELCLDQLGWKETDSETICEECVNEILANHKQDQD